MQGPGFPLEFFLRTLCFALFPPFLVLVCDLHHPQTRASLIGRKRVDRQKVRELAVTSRPLGAGRYEPAATWSVHERIRARVNGHAEHCESLASIRQSNFQEVSREVCNTGARLKLPISEGACCTSAPPGLVPNDAMGE